MGQQHPDDPCILVGQAHGGDVFVAPAHALIQPAIRLGFVACMVNDGTCAVDESGAQVSIAPLADTQQILFSSAGFLPGH